VAPRIYRLTVRDPLDPNKLGSKVIDDGKLAQRSPHNLVLLVHGYNNTEEDAENSYQTFIDHLMSSFDEQHPGPDSIAKFHWPGNVSTLFGSTVGYPFDINNARGAANLIAAYLIGIPVPTLRVTLVGHSMGCRLILEALNNVRSATPNISIVGLMAAASPVDLVRPGARLFWTGNPPRRMLKYFSEQDAVLLAAFPLGQWAAYQLQIESDNYSEAIGRHGNPDEFGSRLKTNNRHGQYWPDKMIAAGLARQIAPTLAQPTATASLATRSLEPATTIASRKLPTRSLPS
jgi:pimeloyl-ACP methyl ester carboxylesterase